MKPEIQLLIAKQHAGGKLSIEEIHTLMIYALELLQEFGAMTQASINRAQIINRAKFIK